MKLILFFMVAVAVAGIGAPAQALERGKTRSPRQLEMVSLPKGVFARADASTVSIPAFALAATETTKAQWDAVRTWALGHGYDMAAGSGSGDFPVGNITWYDAVKWCNALSEITGKTPVYYLDAAHVDVFRSGQTNLSAESVKWDADGYRLPTEAEWEYACRAGTSSRYYWGDTATPGAGNPYAWCNNWETPCGNTNEVARLTPNGFGLYDMSGNVEEWCWDWYGPHAGAGEIEHPKGPAAGAWRILRGGSVALDSDVGSGTRHYTYPAYQIFDIGFRVASSRPESAGLVGIEAIGREMEEAHARDLEPREQDAATLAGRLFGLLDPSAEGLEHAWGLFDAGDYVDALNAYRDYCFGKLRAATVPSSRRFHPSKNRADVLMQLSPPLDWFHLQYRDESSLDSPGRALTPTRSLVAVWRETREPKYLDKWLALTDDFMRHNKRQFDALTPEEKAHEDFFRRRLSWTWCQGYDTTERVEGVLGALHLIAQELDPHEYAAVPGPTLAAILISCVTDHVAAMIKDARYPVSNQLAYNSATLITMGHVLNEFRDANAWLAEGRDRFTEAVLNRGFLPDGGDLEQSFNYNTRILGEIDNLKDLFGGHAPEWMTPFDEAITLRKRMFAALQFPFGGLPATGTNTVLHPPALWKDESVEADWKKRRYEEARHSRNGFLSLTPFTDPLLEQLVDVLFGPAEKSPPAFTSIAFPYSGFYALRDGWTTKSRYLWFMAARRGTGHASEDINSVAVAAFGRHLLADANSPPYDEGHLVEEQRPYYEKTWRYQTMSFSHNTVTVDGQSQRRVLCGEISSDVRRYNDPIAARWHTSDTFDFVEGRYADGYGNTPDVNVDVEHARQIVFVKPAGFWIVTDRMRAGQPHRYAQVWKFPPPPLGFGEEHVIIDASANTVRTADPDGPNVALHLFSAEPIEYAKYFGSIEPFYGWYSFGVAGRRVASVDLHATWPGDSESVLVTLIVPQQGVDSPFTSVENLSSDGPPAVRGFAATMPDGTQVSYKVGVEKSALTIEDLAITGDALLVASRPDGSVSGLALGVEQATYAGRRQPAAQPDFAFELGGDGLDVTAPIRVPTTFRWVPHGPTVVPAYE